MWIMWMLENQLGENTEMNTYHIHTLISVHRGFTINADASVIPGENLNLPASLAVKILKSCIDSVSCSSAVRYIYFADTCRCLSG